MYQVESTTAVARAGRILLAPSRTRERVGKTVLLLGVTSLLTDISSEMVATILPLYLIYTAGLTPVQFGVVDGIYQGGAAIVRTGAGFVADRSRRLKEVAVCGYGISTLCRPLMIAVGSAWGALGAVVFLDRVGKGIRTAPRDALISISSPRERLGAAFGVHRALDTTGAMLGPLIGFGILMLIPNGFRSVFVVSTAFAILGLAVLVLYVHNPPRERMVELEGGKEKTASLRGAVRLLGPGRFAVLSGAAGLLAVFTISDGFVYLNLQERTDFGLGYFPLLYTGTALVYMTLAAPVGALGDRVGRGKVFLAGYVTLLLMYLVLLAGPDALPAIALVLALFGVYYAATDGVLAAMASAVLPAELRATGLSVLSSITGIARLGSSILFGAMWTAGGVNTAVAIEAVGLACAIPLAALLVRMNRVKTVVA